MLNNNNVEMLLGTNNKEEAKMLEQVQKFNDIAKTIEEIDAAGGDVYIGGVKVSWESVKEFIYGLSDDELKLLAYSNKPEIPAEMEVFAIYLLEAEKAWNNELTLQNAYFNSKKKLSMDLQFFASKEKEEENEMENTNKEELEMKEFYGEVKDFLAGHIERALITDQGETYLVKAYMLESDGRIKVPHHHFPSYTLSKEMEGVEYAIYTKEEEDEEEEIKMNLQFPAKGGTNKKRVSEAHTLALSHIETLEKERENLLSFLEGRKEDELTSDIQQELCNVESSIKRWSSIHNESLRSRAKEGAIKLGRGY